MAQCINESGLHILHGFFDRTATFLSIDVFVTKMYLILKFKFKIGHLTNNVISVWTFAGELSLLKSMPCQFPCNNSEETEEVMHSTIKGMYCTIFTAPEYQCVMVMSICLIGFVMECDKGDSICTYSQLCRCNELGYQISLHLTPHHH